MNWILYSAKSIVANILPRFVHVRSCPELLFEGGVDGNKGRCCTLVASAQQALSRQVHDAILEAAAVEVETHWNHTETVVNQHQQALRSAAAIRKMKFAPSPLGTIK